MKFKDESFEDGVEVSQHVILPTWLQNCKDEKVHTMDNQVIIFSKYILNSYY